MPNEITLPQQQILPNGLHTEREEQWTHHCTLCVSEPYSSPIVNVHVHSVLSWQSTGLATQGSRVRIPSEAAQCFFHCLPSDFALLASLVSLVSFPYTCTRLIMYMYMYIQVHMYIVDIHVVAVCNIHVLKYSTVYMYVQRRSDTAT